MKTIVLVFCLLVTVAAVYAQKTQQLKNDSVCQLVKKYWAEKNADKIYDMAGEAFRQQLSLADFRTACIKNLFPKGPMKTQFEGFENGVTRYKAVFTADSLSFYLSVDNKNKLANFLFKPYGN